MSLQHQVILSQKLNHHECNYPLVQDKTHKVFVQFLEQDNLENI